MDSTQPLQPKPRPTVGRIVHYHYRTEDLELVQMAAIVTAVGHISMMSMRGPHLSFETVDLAVFGGNGMFFRKGCVESDEPRVDCWSWPPKV